SALKPPAGLAAAVDELSPTSYLGPRAISNLFQGGKEVVLVIIQAKVVIVSGVVVEKESKAVVKTKGIVVMQVGKIYQEV
nr:hypothetical protein [Tanacetum cinerariifolium]